MSDPLRTAAPRAADALSGLERDARVEQLLLQGLDDYFAGEYESAIHVWTRVLFLDRGHARARAYIERARSAQAERQRESEELLHRGVAAFDRGDASRARELLTAAVSQGALPEVALSYLGRLDRLQLPRERDERPHGGRPAEAQPPPPALPPPPRARLGVAALSGLSVLVICGAAWVGLALFELVDLRAALQLRTAGGPPPGTIEDPLPVPRAAALALTRAQAQFAAGHLGEALRLLEAIPRGDPLQREADQLRAEIQQTLLTAVPAAGGAARPGVTNRGARP